MQCSDPERNFHSKKLEKTASFETLSNFFFGLIFQNSILQQALITDKAP